MRWLGSTGLATVLALAGLDVACAQEANMIAPPPVRETVDSRGVDLTTGALTLTATPLSIGPHGAGGLSYSRSFVGNGWRDSFVGGVTVSGSTVTVSIGGSSEAFTQSGASFTPQVQDGSTLTSTSGSYPDYTYTTNDGTVYEFSPGDQSAGGPWSGSRAVLISISYPAGELITYFYDSFMVCQGATGSPSYVCNRDGAPTVYRLAGYTSNTGYQIGLTYQGSSRPGLSEFYKIVGVTGYNTSDGQTTVSAGADSTSITDSVGHTTSFGYDSSGHITSIQKGNGVVVTYGYSAGRVHTVSDTTGIWTYSFSNGETTVADPSNNIVRDVTYDGSGQVLTDADGLQRTTHYAWNSLGQVMQLTKPGGNVLNYTYDARGNITQATTTSKDGSTQITTSAGYEAGCSNPATCNKPQWTRDANGNQTDYTYTAFGTLASTAKPAGANGLRPETDYSYAQMNAPSGGQVWRLGALQACATAQNCSGSAAASQVNVGYATHGDANNLLPTTVTTQAGDGSVSSMTTMVYDGVGHPYLATDPLGQVTRYRYDAAGELLGVVGPDPDGSGSAHNRAVRNTYDARGNLVLTERGTVPSNSDSDWANFTSLVQTATTYDGLDRTVQTASGASGSAPQSVSQASYDASGRLACSAIRMNPAAFGSLPGSACQAGPLGVYGPDRLKYYAYDLADQLTAVTDGVGTSTQRYPVRTSYGPDGETLTQTDAKGNVTTYGYDGFDRLASVCLPDPSNVGASTTACERYGYEARSLLSSDIRRDGQVITYSYDALGQRTSSTDGRGWGYDNLQRLTNAHGNGQDVAYYYDALGRLTAQSDSGIGAAYFGYDSVGNRTRLTWPDGFYVSYAFDNVGEPTSVVESNGGVPTAFYYDDLGRPSATGRSNGVSTFWSYTGLSLTGLSQYYPNGNGNETYTYSYNPAGQLVSQTSSNHNYDWVSPFNVSRGYGTDGQNRYTTSGPLNLTYDGRGNLASDTQTSQSYDINNKLTSVSNGAQLGYDAGDRLASVTGSSTTQFLYEGDHIIAEYQGGTLLRRFVPGNLPDQPSLWYEGSDTSSRRWLLADRQGSTVGIADASASPSYNTYDEAGLPGPSNTGRFQYDGQPWIAEAGLYHMRARAYSPTLGRFMQTDPSGYADGLNLYGYALGDPVNAADPSGLNCDYPAGAAEVLVCGAPNAPEGTEGGGRGANSYVSQSDGPKEVVAHGKSKGDLTEVVVTGKRLQKTAQVEVPPPIVPPEVLGPEFTPEEMIPYTEPPPQTPFRVPVPRPGSSLRPTPRTGVGKGLEILRLLLDLLRAYHGVNGVTVSPSPGSPQPQGPLATA